MGTSGQQNQLAGPSDVCPGRLAIERQQDAGEDIGLDGAAPGTDRFSGTHHVRRLDVVADHLEREIGFDRGGDVEGAGMIERPAAMLALDAAQVIADLPFELEVGRLGEVVHQQDIFRRDGGVGLELEHPMAVAALLLEQGRRRVAQHPLDGIVPLVTIIWLWPIIGMRGPGP